ncbi:colicin V production protein [Pseudoxanthomonas kalamensis DSM 18571]|uniref:CvpA family protein n=1 Tax=Pseudoxanthomonas kalamensis TaxID=289483 RepID=UPI001391AD6C|nr:CvpA family protein [Pseudoxanthomonas kalamensis]KAF1709392.1 colicin V production protein [Pseudoxanthomonas kalamensis DSM 18571]
MGITDLSLLAIIGLSALFGLMRGFIGVLASIAAWLLAGWAAFGFGAEVAWWLADDGTPNASELLGGYALSFVVVMLCVGLVGWIVRKLVKSIGLSGLDRVLGLGLGLLRGGFIACCLLLLLGFTGMPQEPSWRQSAVVRTLLPGAEWLRGWLPDWAAQQVDFGNAAPNGDNGGQDRLPVPLDEGVPQDSQPRTASDE